MYLNNVGINKTLKIYVRACIYSYWHNFSRLYYFSIDQPLDNEDKINKKTMYNGTDNKFFQKTWGKTGCAF